VRTLNLPAAGPYGEKKSFRLVYAYVRTMLLVVYAQDVIQPRPHETRRLEAVHKSNTRIV